MARPCLKKKLPVIIITSNMISVENSSLIIVIQRLEAQGLHFALILWSAFSFFSPCHQFLLQFQLSWLCAVHQCPCPNLCRQTLCALKVVVWSMLEVIFLSWDWTLGLKYRASLQCAVPFLGEKLITVTCFTLWPKAQVLLGSN
jgi:hypothetical protein